MVVMAIEISLFYFPLLIKIF